MSETARTDDAAQTLLDAAQTVITALDRWAEAEVDYLIEHPAGDAINAMCALAHSRFPADSSAAVMDLFLQIHEVARHWRAYVEDDLADHEGLPVDDFWNAIKGLTRAIDFVKIPERPPLETVQELWRQMGSFPGRAEAIAKIYGHTIGGVWQGPFFDKMGRVNPALVQKEAEEPNSVLPKDWVPESEKKRRDKEAKLAAENLAKVRLLLRKNETRPKAAELLKEGQFPDVIARVCEMSEVDVRALAHQMGLKIVEREDVLNSKDTIAAADPIADARGFAESESVAGMLSEQETRPAALKPIDEDGLRTAVVELLEQDPDATQGTILRVLVERGLAVKSGEVKKILKGLQG